MRTFLAFLVALPEIIKLVREIMRVVEQSKTRVKVKEDIKAINEAFKNKDSKALNRIFNSR